MKKRGPQIPDVVDHLDMALDALLAARIALGDLPRRAPGEGLDAALMGDDSYQRARQAFSEALTNLSNLVPSGVSEDVLMLEEKVNDLVCTTADVGWRLGAALRRTA